MNSLLQSVDFENKANLQVKQTQNVRRDLEPN